MAWVQAVSKFSNYALRLSADFAVQFSRIMPCLQVV